MTETRSQNFTVTFGGTNLSTPTKRALNVPTQALAEAITAEWQEHKKFSSVHMPLTALAYTAIDRIDGQVENIIEALMVYVDTDTLSYRSDSDNLAKLQHEKWDPIVGWASRKFGAIWQTTSGIMPIEQPEAMHEAIRQYLSALDAFRLSAFCVLASCFSSLVLAVAVVEKHVDGDEAFRLSRLEEEAQAEQWGRDEEADKRAEKVKAEILAAERFLRLLEA